MAHWNSTDLNWKIFNDVNRRRQNASEAGEAPQTNPPNGSNRRTTTSAPSSADDRGSTSASLSTKALVRRTTPPILTAFESTPRPIRIETGIRSRKPANENAKMPEGSDGGAGGVGGPKYSSSPRPLQRHHTQTPPTATVATTVSPIIASATALLSTVLNGHQTQQQRNSTIGSRNVIAGQLSVVTPPAHQSPSSSSSAQVDASSRTLYNQYVDTVSNLASNIPSPSSSSLNYQNGSSGEVGTGGVSVGGRVATKMEAIVSSLANFSTSESSELLLDTDNGSRNGGAGGSVGEDATDRDLELNFRANNNFMLLYDKFGEYFYNFNGTTDASGGEMGEGLGGAYGNFSNYDSQANCSLANTTCGAVTEIEYNYWALLLILFPFLTLFGNVLVILSVCRERALHTVTNYFIVSLAIADLLVAVVVMPFGVYILVNGAWSLPNVVCDFYIAMDVICSTSSIFNLVAISIDRYIAVTQPIKYAKHKNSRRVCLTILLVWAISAAIGSPIVLGLNNTPERVPDLCVFYNSDFIVYSSLSSFYIPCIIMVFLYWNIFKALRSRARKQRAARKPHLSDMTTGGGGGGTGGGSIIENVAQTRKLAETTLDSSKSGSKILPDEERPTNTASGSNEEEDDNVGSPDVDDCHVIANNKSTEFILATVVEEAGNVMAHITSPSKRNATSPATIHIDPNGNQDSGYAPSNIDDIVTMAPLTPPGSPRIPMATIIVNRAAHTHHQNHRTNGAQRSPKKEPHSSVAMRPLSFMRSSVQDALSLARNDSTLSTNSRGSMKDKKNSQASRFTIYKVHKASKKKREKSSAKKERKATKTLAIVLGVFLICWVPFFTANILDAICAKLDADCRPGVTVFILTTWLGYMNSFVNPVIYTIFNPEFRKAFKKIMHIGT